MSSPRARRAVRAGRVFGVSPGSALKSLLGLALAPTAFGTLLAAAAEFGSLGPRSGGKTGYFLGAFLAYAAAHALGLIRLRRLYVFAHEATHALAVWLGGGKVYAFVVKAESGHVDLSHSSVFVALAPYWLPLYTLAVLLAYRVALWLGPPAHAREVFLAAMGATLAFHLAHTAASLWDTRQSDLDEAGPILSLSLIAFLNGGLILAALKCLFPGLVSLDSAARGVWSITLEFWRGAAGLAGRAFALVA